MGERPRRLFIVDANVLIDFAQSDRSILPLVAQYLGPVYVPRALLFEVRQYELDVRECERLGLVVVEESPDQLDESITRRPSRALSQIDTLCLILARDNGWTCVTNDKALRRHCEEAGVAVLWGLRLLIELVEVRALTDDAAIRIALMIRENNPYFGGDLIEQFAAQVRSLDRVPKVRPGRLDSSRARSRRRA